MSRFSKLKKQIDGLFDPELKMEFCCSAYPMRPKNGYAHRSLPRFYVKLGKEIIWDFPKDFDVENMLPYWASDNGISVLVKEYIDTPVDELLYKKFTGEFEERRFIPMYRTNEQGERVKYSTNHSNADVVVSLTDLFKAADRRIGKKKVMEWTGYAKNFQVYKIVCIRLFGWESIIKTW